MSPMLLLLLAAIAANASAQQNFDSCGSASFYDSLKNDPSKWSKDDVARLLRKRHRRVLPMTGVQPGENDVWAALKDVDGVDGGRIHLVYEDSTLPKVPFGSNAWVRSQMFPPSRGVGVSGPDASDVHNLRATTNIADLVRGSKFFGECGALLGSVDPETCQEPAEGAADTSCSCERTYEPPDSAKGVVARALMYMDLRYDGSEDDTLDLRLTDCPFEPERDMAYLSQMLEWHEAYPPTFEEMRRNDKVCESWQGNRNPFVDHPELARQFFGEPQPLPAAGEKIYEHCKSVPTSSPTQSLDQCDMLNPSDIQIWLMNSVDPITVGFFSFKPLMGDFDLYMTDSAWNGNEFTDDEGTVGYVVPDGGFPAGTAFGYPASQSWTEEGGDFELNEQGDIIFLYCVTADGTHKPLLAYSYGGEFVEPGLTSYGPNQSALPEGLTAVASVIELEKFKNYIFNGDSNVPVSQLKENFRNQTNWLGSDSDRFEAQIPSHATSGAGRRSAAVAGPIVAAAAAASAVLVLAGLA